MLPVFTSDSSLHTGLYVTLKCSVSSFMFFPHHEARRNDTEMIWMFICVNKHNGFVWVFFFFVLFLSVFFQYSLRKRKIFFVHTVFKHNFNYKNICIVIFFLFLIQIKKKKNIWCLCLLQMHIERYTLHISFVKEGGKKKNNKKLW